MSNSIGRRKEAVARVTLSKGKGKITVNKKDVEEYFPSLAQVHSIMRPFLATETKGKYNVIVNVKGGGYTGQAEAVTLGISRALVIENEEYKTLLKAESLMTRDSRVVERKKPGQKKARKKFQFTKR